MVQMFLLQYRVDSFTKVHCLIYHEKKSPEYIIKGHLITQSPFVHSSWVLRGCGFPFSWKSFDNTNDEWKINLSIESHLDSIVILKIYPAQFIPHLDKNSLKLYPSTHGSWLFPLRFVSFLPAISESSNNIHLYLSKATQENSIPFYFELHMCCMGQLFRQQNYSNEKD